jgi:hypothetical protein
MLLLRYVSSYSHPLPPRLVIEQRNRTVSKKQKALSSFSNSLDLLLHLRGSYITGKKSSTYPSGGTPLSSAWAGRACSPQSARAWYHRRGGKPFWQRFRRLGENGQREAKKRNREEEKDAILHGAADGDDRKEKKTCRSSGDSGTAIMEGQAGRQVGSTALAGG